MKFSRCFALLMLGGAAYAGETVMETIPLHNRPAEAIQPLLMPLLESGDRVVGNGFSLIVKTTPARLNSIRKLIDTLDSRQHNLTVSVLQSSHKTAAELNAEAGIAISQSAIQMHGMAGNSRDLDDTRTAQHIRTLDGQPAHIQIGELKPVENVTVYDSGYGYPAIGSSSQLREANTGFAVTPRLVDEREVILDITPWSDRFRADDSIATQEASTSIRARLGEWVEIAGSADSSRNDNRGFNGMNVRTSRDDVRILLKVDLAD